jgi:hypothetical protein
VFLAAAKPSFSVFVNSHVQGLYIVDVFERKGKRKGKLRRINSVRFYPMEGFTMISADILWVDPKTQKIPILILGLRISDAFSGTIGSYVLVNFPRGFNSRANTQQYGFSSDNTQSDQVGFNKVDERGFTMVTLFHRYYSGEGNKDTDLRWTGDKFSPAKETPIKEGVSE